jgi:hypothetical protein
MVRAVNLVTKRGYLEITRQGWIYRFPWTGTIVILDVSEVWKGLAGKGFVLRLSSDCEDDTYDGFRRGESYVVFAQRNSSRKTAQFGLSEPTYGAHGCGGTGLVMLSDAYLRELGRGRLPIGAAK